MLTKNRKIRSVAKSVLPILAFIVIWELAAEAIDLKVILPTASMVFATLLEKGSFLIGQEFQKTMSIAGVAYIVGGTTAILTGVIITIDDDIQEGIMPLLVAFNSFPRLLLAPILLYYIGGRPSKYLIAIWIAYFPIAVTAVEGFGDIEEDMEVLMDSFDATRLQRYRHVRTWHALPFIFDGLKIGIPLAIIGALVSEFVAASGEGLGYIAFQSLTYSQGDIVVAIVVITATTSVSLFLTAYYLQDKIVHWKTASMFTEE